MEVHVHQKLGMGWFEWESSTDVPFLAGLIALCGAAPPHVIEIRIGDVWGHWMEMG